MEEKVCTSAAPMDSGNPLLRAVFLRRLRLTRLLLEGGSYINESDSQGQTPLMVACRTQHCDAQSASRVKLVQFLLEKGADPNIQDKEGLTALMHACRERAGPEVVSLLLDSGADINLEDQSGRSALVHAVMAGERVVLKLLLEACKAKGKDVIIIATDKFPVGEIEANQYLSVSGHGSVDQTTAAAPASPSEIQLITSPQSTSSSLCPPKPVFSFREAKSCCLSSNPGSPSRYQGLGQVQQQQYLQRLNSEPWLKLPTPLPHAASLSSNEKVPLRVSTQEKEIDSCEDDEERLAGNKGAQRQCKGNSTKHGRQKISLPGLLSTHSASHPNLHHVNLGADLAASSSFSCLSSAKVHSLSPHGTASSSLHSILQRTKLGADIYNSDPQLAGYSHHIPTENKKLAPLHRSSTLCSREPPFVLGPNSKVLSRFNRRGSDAFLLEQSSQAKPRSLPPLSIGTLNAPNPNNYSFGSKAGVGFPGERFLPSAPPGQSTELSRRRLLRRHSMQTEQFKTTA